MFTADFKILITVYYMTVIKLGKFLWFILYRISIKIFLKKVFAH